MISIILPFYNAEAYLERCVQSILRQTFQDWELLLINDGSTDSSLQICQSYVGLYDNITLFSQENLGVSAARNKGVCVARGEYVMFVDSDDYMLPPMCETMVRAMEDKGADLVVCGTTETWGGGWGPKRDMDYFDMDLFKSDFIEHLTSELLSPPWNKIYKRELIKKLFDTSTSFGEDLIFNLEYLKNCKRISFITSSPFYHEKANEHSLVNRVYPSRLMEIEKVHSAVLDFCNCEDSRIHNKYLRDLLVYYRAIVRNENYSRREIQETLGKWIRSSHLRTIRLNRAPMGWKNRLLLRLLKFRMWGIAEAIVKYKSLFKVQSSS